MATVTLIHATPAAIPPVVEAFAALPQVRLLHQLDEALLTEIDRHGGVTVECRERMACQLRLAASAGSDVVLTTCNAYSLALMRDIRPHFLDVPVVVIDEPMVRRAVAADRVGVVATVPAGLESQRELLTAVAQDAQRSVDITYSLRQDAFQALTAGDAAEHDRIVLEEVERLRHESEIVVLAQASMARVLRDVPVAYADRVLSSPPLAVEAVANILAGIDA